MAIFYVAILFILFLHNKIYLTDDSEQKKGKYIEFIYSSLVVDCWLPVVQDET